MFDRPISWGELITVVLFLLGAALLFYLILAVANLVRILKNVNRIMDRNKDNINGTIEKLPKIASNAEKITESLKNNMEGIDKVVQDVGKISTSVRKGVETVQKDILAKATIFLDIINAIKGFFEKKKKASPSKKKGTTVYRYKYKRTRKNPRRSRYRPTGRLKKSPMRIMRLIRATGSWKPVRKKTRQTVRMMLRRQIRCTISQMLSKTRPQSAWMIQ